MPNLEHEIGCWDSVLLEILSEDSFINNLHQRYKRDQIYTQIGTFLVAVNPFKPLNLYTQDQLQIYANKNIFKLPPHIYGITNSSYQWLLDHNEDQCIILSGESNSGKTESCRLIVHFLTHVSEARRTKHVTNSRQRHSSVSFSSSKHVASINTKDSEKVCLLKQSSFDIDKSILKKCSHDKTVEFDFSHHKSADTLPLNVNKCQKHSTSFDLSKSTTSKPQCSKHNSIEFGRSKSPQPRIFIDSCMKKSTCDLSNVHNPNRHETHLLGCHKSAQRECDTSLTSPNKLRTNCKRCGHFNCGKLTNQDCDDLTCNSKWVNSSPVRKIVHETDSIERLTRSRSLSVQTKKNRKYAINVNRFSSAFSSSSLDTVGNSNMQLKMRERIEQADVFLEALGNASTSKNFNSSRYGQFFNIEFDFKGDPIGGRIYHYSLEKTRVTSKSCGERNFHIFYQLISGADIQFLKSLKLHRNIDKYELLNHANATDDDKNNFSYTKKSLEVLGLNQDEILSIFKIIAVVIKLGNLVFVPTQNIDGTEGCNISNEYELMETAQLLNLDAQILLNCLTRADNGWSSIENGVDSDWNSANRSRNSLCRIMYGRLFTWVVNRINDLLKSRSSLRGKNFGVLDFYGFENFEFNSFEQLIINYCDERIHQHCIRSSLKYQQELYVREGLEWNKVDFFDNEIICDLIDKSNYGILNLMDEPHMACDDSLLLRMQQCCAGHPNFLSLDSNAPYAGFQIRHFAGSVQYSINGFLEKNSEFLPRNVSTGLYQSKLPVVQSLFPEGNPKRLSRKPTSIGSSLRTQLQTLLSMVETRKTNYVFCIKPNEHKQKKVIEMPLVQHQVRYMSLMPLVALWRSGHCYHINHNKFLQRYKMLNLDTWPHFRGGSVVEGIAILIRKFPLPHAEFTIGTRKVFIRSPRTVYELEEFRRSRLDSLACLIQTKFRSYSKRKEFLALRNSQIIISSAWRTWRECRFGVPFSGRRHLWGLYRVAREEYRQQKYRKQVQWAISVIQRQYLQWKRRHFLVTLLLHLPPDSLSPLSAEWTAAPAFLAETSLLLRNIYHRWRCYKYRLKFDQTARNRMREKVTASIIFKDRKSSYPRSVAHPFLGDYVRLRHNSQWRKLCIDSSDQYVVFADIINKIARSSGKFVPILLVLSTSSMLLLDQRTLQIKYRVPATEIYRLSLSPYLDNIAVFHVKADCNNQQVCTETGCLFQSEIGRKKGDFVFQTGHVIEIVTKLFLVIQNATAKPPEVHISTEFEANFGQQTVVFTFKCSGMVGDVCPTKVTRKETGVVFQVRCDERIIFAIRFFLKRPLIPLFDFLFHGVFSSPFFQLSKTHEIFKIEQEMYFGDVNVINPIKTAGLPPAEM